MRTETAGLLDLRAVYIDGAWRASDSTDELAVIDPATEEPFAIISVGNDVDVGSAVEAARCAFPDFAATTVDFRRILLRRILEAYQARYEAFAQAISREMGAPISFARAAHAAAPIMHIEILLDVLQDFPFWTDRNSARIFKEPVGVCGLITPWNFPVHQVMGKVAPAIAAGCTVVLKPSEQSPVSTHLLAEVMHEAGVPPGVFNLVNGDGPRTGQLLSAHPDLDVISFTGSTQSGQAVAKAAASSITRPTLELGGKSANIIVDDEKFAASVAEGVQALMLNSGQNCMAPSRMLVPAARVEEAAAIAAHETDGIRVALPSDADGQLGPVVSLRQWETIQEYIALAIEEGATVACGGAGRPDHLERGYFVRPTVLHGITNHARVAREEIFGPVLCIIGYGSLDEAVEIANDSPYGLAAYVQAADHDLALGIASRIRAGSVFVNNPPYDLSVPIGGFKMSGYGREWGTHGLEEMLTSKAVVGFRPAASGAGAE